MKVRFLGRDEFHIFLDLYRETEARTGFVSKQTNISITLDTYGDKVLVPLAYIDLDEYIKSLQDALNDKENRRDQMMAKENKMINNLEKLQN